jgi:MFS family permease
MAVEPASYRGLMAVPGFTRVAVSTVLARLEGQMWQLVLVIFVLQRYRSPSLAGVVVLFAVLPGLILSPLVGALLDRQGRIRLMVLDYVTTATLSGLIVALSTSRLLPPPLLLAIVTVLSISNIMSITGARSLFPLMLPRALWDRANGLDSSSYSLTTILGPAIAGVVVARLGPEAGLLATAAVAAVAAVSLLGVAEPVARVQPSSSLLRDARDALTYVLRHASLRGLAATLFLVNLGFGVLPVGIPVLVLHKLHGNAATIGQIFAVFGLAGLVAGLVIGRLSTEGRERQLIAGAIGIEVPMMSLLAVTGSLPMLFALAFVDGIAGTAINVGTFGLRQRRTEPAWFGRAFAVSMSLNVAGQPFGSALSGPLLEHSTVIPFLLSAAITVLALLSALSLIPGRHTDAADPARS